jgi:sodium/hydrogen antiporter
VAWEIGAGVAGGWAIGKLFGWMTFHVPAKTKLAKTGDGLIAISATFVSYGLTEMINCYGFLAVFVTALTLRQSNPDDDFHHSMHEITEQVERLAMMVLLLVFGGALASGLLAPLGWREVALALLILLVVRPVAGLIGLIGFRAAPLERGTIAFFGIRGVGSIYYLAYGLNHMDIAEARTLWSITGLVILLSVLIHGLSVTPVMRLLDKSQGRDPDSDDGEAVPPPGLQGPAEPASA